MPHRENAFAKLQRYYCSGGKMLSARANLLDALRRFYSLTGRGIRPFLNALGTGKFEGLGQVFVDPSLRSPSALFAF
jgi:hypothetical protein